MKAAPFNPNAPAVTSFALPPRAFPKFEPEPLKGNVADRRPSKFTPVVHAPRAVAAEVSAPLPQPPRVAFHPKTTLIQSVLSGLRNLVPR